jgi:phage antirepressor YoqD-like protein
MKEIANLKDERMTVGQVAKQLGCNPETIKVHIREFFPGLMQNGKTTYLNEAQITVILEKMKSVGAYAHHVTSGVSTYNSRIAGINTSQSRVFQLDLLYRQIVTLKDAEINELKTKNEQLQLENGKLVSKAAFFDTVADSKDAISMREVAAVLNYPNWGRNRIFDLLRRKKIVNNKNEPYRLYQDKGYFRVIEQQGVNDNNEVCINLKTLIYQRGVNFIRKLIQLENRGII